MKNGIIRENESPKRNGTIRRNAIIRANGTIIEIATTRGMGLDIRGNETTFTLINIYDLWLSKS